MLSKIISGGQTGADRGGLDAAMMLGIETGGTAPLDYAAEDIMPERYRRLLSESVSGYLSRTRQNVLDADATIIFTFRYLTGGSKLTAQFCLQLGKPHLHVSLRNPDQARPSISAWLRETDPAILNVAGNRESKSPGIQVITAHILTEAIFAARGHS